MTHGERLRGTMGDEPFIAIGRNVAEIRLSCTASHSLPT